MSRVTLNTGTLCGNLAGIDRPGRNVAAFGTPHKIGWPNTLHESSRRIVENRIGVS